VLRAREGVLGRVSSPGRLAVGSSRHSSRRWSRGGRGGRPRPASWRDSRTPHAATDLDRLVTEVTVIKPSHPLYGQRLAVASLRSSRGPDWVTAILADGRQRQVRRSATDLAAPPAGNCEHRQVSVRTLLPLAHYIRAVLLATAEEVSDDPPDAAGQPTQPTIIPPEPRSGPRTTAVASAVCGHAATAGADSRHVDPADAGADADTGRQGDRPC
jgi:hypothetical protein